MRAAGMAHYRAMPYKVGAKRNGRYPIMRKRGGRWSKVASSSSKSKAQASVRARYAAER